MVPGLITFTFKNLHREVADLSSRWDVLLGFSADFTIHADQALVYEQHEFCVVEFAVALVPWLVASDHEAVFDYTSEESAVEHLVQFLPADDGGWTLAMIGPDGKGAAARTVELSALKAGAIAFLRDLRRVLKPTLELCDYVDGAGVRSECISLCGSSDL